MDELRREVEQLRDRVQVLRQRRALQTGEHGDSLFSASSKGTRRTLLEQRLRKYRLTGVSCKVDYLKKNTSMSARNRGGIVVRLERVKRGETITHEVGDDVEADPPSKGGFQQPHYLVFAPNSSKFLEVVAHTLPSEVDLRSLLRSLGTMQHHGKYNMQMLLHRIGTSLSVTAPKVNDAREPEDVPPRHVPSL